MKKIIELGDYVQDTVTGFKGVAVARTQWLYGCSRINIQPKIDKDGKLGDTISFDEPSLIILKKKVQGKIDNTTGGPRMTVLKV